MANILLVDDRPENLLALEAILEPLEQNLLYAHSGEEALRQLLQHDVAIILLDVQMPVLDGFETATLNGELDYVNQRALDYFDTSFLEQVSSGWPEVTHPEDRPRMVRLWQEALDKGCPYENELRLRRAADESYRWHLTRAVPMRN